MSQSQAVHPPDMCHAFATKEPHLEHAERGVRERGQSSAAPAADVANDDLGAEVPRCQHPESETGLQPPLSLVSCAASRGDSLYGQSDVQEC
jgi:hypothetical protein